MLSFRQFKKLRGEIVLNSLYLSDYENSLGIDPQYVYDFFEGYLEYEMTIFCEEHPKATARQKDNHFEKIIDKNDLRAMYDHYLQIEGDCLPIED